MKNFKKCLAVLAALFAVFMYVYCGFYSSDDTLTTLTSGKTFLQTPRFGGTPAAQPYRSTSRDTPVGVRSSTEWSVDTNSSLLASAAPLAGGRDVPAQPTWNSRVGASPRKQSPSSHLHDSHFPTTASSAAMSRVTESRTTAPTARRYLRTAATSAARPRNEVKRTFMITHTFGGQLTRALRNLMTQQCWARGLISTATLLEPFSSESLLLHTPNIWDAVRRGRVYDVARFSDFFDLRLYNRVSVAGGGVPLVMWEEFLMRAPRQVVAVITPHTSCALVVNHLQQTTVDEDFKDFLKGLRFLNFVVIKIVPINCYDRNRSQKFVEELSPFLLNSTLAFSSWRNFNVVRTWLDVDAHCDVSDNDPADRLSPSTKMKMHMQNYRSKVLDAHTTIAIMLRVERFLTLKSSGLSEDETVDSCLDKTLSVFLGLKRLPRWTSSQPFLTLDIGRYGSGVMQNNDTVSKFNESLDEVTKSVTDLLVRVYGGLWESIEQWEDSFLEATGGIRERGYVAMLQRGIAVQSDCLILMGGGSFQEVAATQYLQAHPDPAKQCLHVVCAATALTTSLGKTRWKNRVPRMGKHKHH